MISYKDRRGRRCLIFLALSLMLQLGLESLFMKEPQSLPRRFLDFRIGQAEKGGGNLYRNHDEGREW